MSRRYIMTAFGVDRPGVVAEVTRLVYESGCNLEDTSMTILADEFAMILLFTGSGDSLSEGLSRECRRLEKEKGISAFFRVLEPGVLEPGVLEPEALEPEALDHGGGRKAADQSRHTLHIEGIDQAGIVYRVSRHLADHGVNIANLSSRREPLPESGTAMYRMEIDIQVPSSHSIDDLMDGLQTLGEEIHVDITV